MKYNAIIVLCITTLLSQPLFPMEWLSSRPIGDTLEKASIDVSDIAKKYSISDQKEIDVLYAIENGNMPLVKKYLNDQDFLNKSSDGFFDAATAVATAIDNTSLANTLKNYKYLKDYANIFP